ncbi:MAG: dockerin type I repeat-containing protein [Candidatus Zixiibacteriota bacterium]
MPFGEKSLKLFRGLILGVLFFIAATPLLAQTPELDIKISDTTGYPGESSLLTVYLTNYTESISGFGIRFSLNRDDIIYFRPEFDTAGTLTSGWEIIYPRLISDDSLDYYILAISNAFSPPEIVPPIPPHQTPQPLIRVPVYLADVPDTAVNRQVSVDIKIDLDNMEFVSADYRTIGLLTDTLVDTLWYNCEAWQSDSCLIWLETVGPPADSMYIDSNVIGWLDTMLINVSPGSITALVPTCGDLNGNLDVDIADITRLISYLYLDGERPVCLRAANVNGTPDGTVDIADITRLIQFLYMNGVDLACPVQ